MTRLLFYQLFRGSREHNLTTCMTTFRANIDDMVGYFYNIHVVFNDHNRITLFNQFMEYIEQVLNIFKVQTCSRFVKDI